MDGGSRIPQSGDRRVVNRAEPARQSEEPRTVKEEPKATYRTDAPSGRDKKDTPPRSRRVAFRVIGVILILAVLALGWVAFSRSQNTGLAIDTSKYQAVFFTNGQVYFGKLSSSGSNYLKLTDIYYLQTQSTDATDSSSLQKTSSDQNNVQLIKLGDEIHGPEDEMIISKDQVLFYENLKTDGKVAKSIANYKTNTKQ